MRAGGSDGAGGKVSVGTLAQAEPLQPPPAVPYPVIARHRLAAHGAGAQVRDHGHVIALEQAAMSAVAGSGRPHRRKERIPPGAAALAAAEALRHKGICDQSAPVDAGRTVTDLPAYERAATGRNTLT